jgi:hypothetical protein
VFYATLFGAETSSRKPDYAKWLLEEPRGYFAIASRRPAAGLDHLGIQVDSADGLEEVVGRLRAADRAVFEQVQAAGCNSVSDKAWSVDPADLSWETFHSTAEATRCGEDSLDPVARARLAKAQAAGGSTADSCCSATGRNQMG